MLRYPVRLTTDDNGTILVDFLDFPEAHTFGDDKDEALARAVDALTTVIAAYIQDRRTVPAPSTRKRGTAVTVPALTAAKVGLHNAMLEQRVNKAELGRRLNWHLPQVDRVVDVHHRSRLDQLEHALQAVDKRLELNVV